MTEKEASRIHLIFLLRERIRLCCGTYKVRLKTNRTTDPDIISTAELFRQWGFMDYLAARVLFVKILEACHTPLPLLEASSVEEFQAQEAAARQKYAVDLLAAGDLMWTAGALAATSVEKYFKAIITIAQKKPPEREHLTTRLIGLVKGAVSNIYDNINLDFVKTLRVLYDLRYHNGAYTEIDISVRGMLAELDLTVAQLEDRVETTLNGIKLPTAYELIKRVPTSDLWKENHILQGIDKLTFWKQTDIAGTLTAPGNAKARRGWRPVDNKDRAQFFYAEVRDLKATALQGQTVNAKDEMKSLTRESSLIRYAVKRVKL